ncbi:MAG: hypothetical protein HYX53_17280 [Chloroflexi bacterium]|nr:hypothetical protein [Chloroflexota bacterium]
MTVLSDVRDRVRKDLRDTDAAAYRWSDAQLERHIDHALTEVSLALPQEKTATLATTSGSRELSLAALDVIEVERVEYPLGSYPPEYVGFATWATSLMLQVDALPVGAPAKLYFTARHTLDGTGTSLSPQQVDLVAMGAGAYAALEQAIYAADRITTGADAAGGYADWGRARLTAFQQLLLQYGRRNRVRGNRLYSY